MDRPCTATGYDASCASAPTATPRTLTPLHITVLTRKLVPALNGCVRCACVVAAFAAGLAHSADLAPAAPPSAVNRLAEAVLSTRDAGGRAFAIVDKPGATLWLFDGQGHPIAHSPVLVGQARGDVAPPDIGTRPLARVKPFEKITSAGRYLTEPGRNTRGEDIVWLDYDAALSMHRVRDVAGESRLQRLQTPSVTDNRISFGCINVPASFYDRHVDPLFSRSAGVVYVLPETLPLARVFPFADHATPAASAR